MSYFEELKIENENTLEHIIRNNPECIESGLKIIDHQVIIPGGKKMDILAVDTDGVLVVMELKIIEDSHMLLQGLEYFDWLNENSDRIAETYSNSGVTVDTTYVPRLILVAPSFSQNLQKASKYICGELCDLSLFEFHYLKSKDNKKGLYCKQIHIQPIEAYARKMEVEDHINYIEDTEIQELFKEVMKKILDIGEQIESKTTQSYIAFQYKNRNVATLDSKKDFFYLGIKGEDDWEYVKIEKASDVTQDHIIAIANTLQQLGGKLKPVIK